MKKDYGIVCLAMAIVNFTNETNGVDIDARLKNNDKCFDYAVEKVKGFLLELAGEEEMLKPNGYSGMKTNGGATCPVCGAKLQTNTYLIKQKYCHDCGQKLDWDIS